MKKNEIIAGLLIIMFTVLGFQSCKKGEDDPFFSFRSRKARVIGEWTCDSLTSFVTTKLSTYNPNGAVGTAKGTYTTDIVLGFNEMTTVTKILGTDSVRTVKASVIRYDLSFDDNGYMNSVFEYKIQTHYVNEELMSDTLVTINVVDRKTGTWNFLGKVDDYKNKERITFVYTDIETTTTTTTSVTLDNEEDTPPSPVTERTVSLDKYANGEYSQVFHIRELRNKKIVLEQKISNLGINNQGFSESNDGSQKMIFSQ